MDPFVFPPIAAVLDLAYSAVASLSAALAPLAGASAAAAAIAVTTLLLRLLLIPVGVATARSAAASRRVAPRVAELRRLHGKNPERMQKELAELYRVEKASPLSGCLPLLAQAPVVAIVYTLFTRPEIAGGDNALLAQTLAGVPLVGSLGHSLVTLPVSTSLVITTLIVFAASMLAAELSRRMQRMQMASMPVAPVSTAAPGSPEAAMASMQAQMMRYMGLMPYITVVVAVFVPLAATIYITISSLWGVAERFILFRRYSAPAVDPGVTT